MADTDLIRCGAVENANNIMPIANGYVFPVKKGKKRYFFSGVGGSPSAALPAGVEKWLNMLVPDDLDRWTVPDCAGARGMIFRLVEG